jgi:HK97 family phage portal protein
LLRRLFGGTKAAGGRTYSLTDEAFIRRILGVDTDAGITISEDTALRLTTVWSCVRLLSETIAGLPWGIYERRRDGTAVPVLDHELAGLLNGSPNLWMTPQDLREAQVSALCLAGNSYSYVERSVTRGMPTSITPDPTITARVLSDGTMEYRRGGALLPQSAVWHLKGFGSNGYLGLSPVGYARQAIGYGLAAESFGARFFKQGAVSSAVVLAKDWLGDKERETARKILNDLWTGLTNAHSVKLLEGGMDIKQVTMPLEDAQFLETRKFEVEEICRIYRVPPYLVMAQDSASYNSLEKYAEGFLQFTLLPYLTRYEQSFARALLPVEQRGRYFLRFDVDALRRADAPGRAGLYSVFLQNGVMSRNEVRVRENLAPSDDPGMSAYTAQVNMAPVSQIGTGGEA